MVIVKIVPENFYFIRRLDPNLSYNDLTDLWKDSRYVLRRMLYFVKDYKIGDEFFDTIVTRDEIISNPEFYAFYLRNPR